MIATITPKRPSAEPKISMIKILGHAEQWEAQGAGVE
jgi:hypothetical protein